MTLQELQEQACQLSVSDCLIDKRHCAIAFGGMREAIALVE
ncbi:MAG: hypothetical protein AAGD25_18590 [Cyanobacteria bacterium P01_F01_bin.150]